jgi:hypothetical protein
MERTTVYTFSVVEGHYATEYVGDRITTHVFWFVQPEGIWLYEESSRVADVSEKPRWAARPSDSEKRVTLLREARRLLLRGDERDLMARIEDLMRLEHL